MERVEVTDLYEAAFLVTEGGRVEGVRCIPLSTRVACCLTITAFEGSREIFQRKEAFVNLAAFRNAYTQVNGLVHEAKKAWEREQKKGRLESQRQVEL